MKRWREEIQAIFSELAKSRHISPLTLSLDVGGEGLGLSQFSESIVRILLLLVLSSIIVGVANVSWLEIAVPVEA